MQVNLHAALLAQMSSLVLSDVETFIGLSVAPATQHRQAHRGVIVTYERLPISLKEQVEQECWEYE